MKDSMAYGRTDRMKLIKSKSKNSNYCQLFIKAFTQKPFSFSETQTNSPFVHIQHKEASI